MKRLIVLITLSALLGGCAWVKGEKSGGADSGTIGGPDIGPGRGTTGVSSGAQGGSGITGSDLAPP